MPDARFNKYRAAIEVLQRGRELFVDTLAEDILDQGDDLIEGGYQFHEFLESQGTRLHFLGLLIGQLEQSAEVLDESMTAPAPTPVPPAKPPAKRRSRSKKIEQQASTKGSTDDL